ncbi:J domain-containing protein [Hymenobacter cellulosilyticus]|uniref:DnaJ domain-containing protein n=1 Tax=Hymenobacter cellulosilyticus TaxID=2932248 RepID=A0A8T9Q3J7_9BACT|nr:DnaJ domain-containing protein [Hymenobacter cellulosilyticus]UOQ72124.1 DnaJ domain-containing protein [Hymenobacter cellulosilyticus]
MQDYYRLLGVDVTASQVEIEQAYQRQKTRLSRRTADPAMQARLREVHTGYEILTHPGRRLAYNVLLAQEPEPELPPDPTALMMARYAPAARWLNLALVAFCLLLALDWLLPPREFARETVLTRQIVSVSSSASDPQMAYDVTTPARRFGCPAAMGTVCVKACR